MATNWDWWACTQQGDFWHSIRETARFMMYEETSPVRTSLSRLAGLLPVWQSRESGLSNDALIEAGQPCPAGEIFFMLLDIIVVNTGMIRESMKPDDNIIDTSSLLKTLGVLQVRIPSFEAVLSSGWPLFGLLVILQEGLFQLGRLAAQQSVQMLRHWGTMAKVCEEALPLHAALNAWLYTDVPGGDLLPLLPPGTRAMALRGWRRWASEQLCHEDPGAAAAARLVGSGLLPEQNATGWQEASRKLARSLDDVLLSISWHRLLFSGWPLLAVLHRLQEAYVREAVCREVERYAYAIPSLAEPESVWVCVRRTADVVDERWRMKGSFPDCGHIVRAMRELRSQLPQSCPFVDVGANLGGCTLMMGKDGHQVLAIEVVPILAKLLEASVRRNGLKSVEVLQVAVAAADGLRGALHCSEGHSAICRVREIEPLGAAERMSEFGGETERRRDEEDTKVATMSLDTILAARSLAPCAVKIDVEGSELEVLKGEATGAQQTLQFHPNLFLELHPYELRERGSSSSEIFDLLIANGYDMFESPSCQDAPLDGRDLWRGNGTYFNVHWANAEPLPRTRLPVIPDHCACVSWHVMRGHEHGGTD
ncbi:Methyltransf_21 domain-containing protein [Durusdinium trenchii]|uniref:Methyltransf_21 domain-containing protein n=1 Tax=Durusdinium trenchii TaxID=1381693 RepID=A0ABP0R5E8_9DINO